MTKAVRRFRFTDSEWKLILEAVSHYSKHLFEVEYPQHQKIWLGQEYFWAHQKDPSSPLGLEWQKNADMCTQIRAKVSRLDLMERRLTRRVRMN